jgi:hypothetical protein
MASKSSSFISLKQDAPDPRYIYSGKPNKHFLRALLTFTKNTKSFKVRFGFSVLFWLCLALICGIFRFVYDREFQWIKSLSPHISDVQTVAFLALGFYVTSSFTHWLMMWNTLPWPDAMCGYLQAVFNGEEHAELRDKLRRYLSLGEALGWQAMIRSFQQKYPTYESLLDLGLITSEELHLLKSTYDRDNHSVLYAIPGHWIHQLLWKEYKKNTISAEVWIKLSDLNQAYFNCIGNAFIIMESNTPASYTLIAGFLTYVFVGMKAIVWESIYHVPIHFVVSISAIGFYCVGCDLLNPLKTIPVESYFDRNRAIGRIFAHSPEVNF